VQTSSRRMLNLILTMLDIQKHENSGLKLDLKDFAAADAINDAFSQVAYLIQGKSLAFRFRDPQNVGLRADYELVVRVLVNLLTNAAKFTPANGRIAVTARQGQDGMCELSVEDTGEGIPPDKLETVFELYSQAQARSLGTARSSGMGLYFCKIVVEAHGRRIGVESEFGKGTKFVFSLPASQSAVKSKNANDFAVLYAEEGAISSEWRRSLAPFYEKFKNLKVYEAGKVLDVLDQISGCDEWKTQVQNAVFTGNDEKYRKLVAAIAAT
ncbi:MAG: HAMP domain-containing sensor histidine kinase, partial [Bacteroidia bacterium]|nr:HAMP domain-containing histidine kinase [Bacteroidia bacterium]MDW8334400.1 HAMP domain-containing sensor histidine kinase [Bacteroidia bacterium]